MFRRTNALRIALRTQRKLYLGCDNESSNFRSIVAVFSDN